MATTQPSTRWQFMWNTLLIPKIIGGDLNFSCQIARSLTEEQTMDLAAIQILLAQGDRPLEEHVSF